MQSLVMIPVDYTPLAAGDVYGVLNSWSYFRAMDTDYSYIILSHETTVVWRVFIYVRGSKYYFASGIYDISSFQTK